VIDITNFQSLLEPEREPYAGLTFYRVS